MRGDRTPLQELSKRVFNSEHRLDLVEVLERLSGLFTVKEMADAAELPVSTVHNELHLMAEVGALQRVPVGRGVSFQIIDGPYWRWCSQLRSLAAKASL